MAKQSKERPYNGGQWTAARFSSFVRSALRRAQWPPKYACIKSAFVRNGTNPKTGRECKLHKCESCGELFPQSAMQTDHREPVVGTEGFVDWNTFIARLYVEKEGFRAICKGCHKETTNQQRKERNEQKRRNSKAD